MDPVGSIIAVVVGIVVVVIVLLFYFYWRQSKQIKTLVDVLKAEKIASNTWSFLSGEKKVTLYYFEGSRYSPSLVSLSLTGDFRGHCIIREETKFDKFCKRLGVNKEAQVLDPEIAGQYYFECEDSDFVKSFMQKAEVKEILKEALKDFTRIEINNNVCSFLKSSASLLSYKPQQLADAAAKLVEFVQFIPHSTSPNASLTVQAGVFESRKKIWGGFATGLFFVGIFYLAWGIMRFCEPVFPWRVFLASLWVSIPIFFLLAPKVLDQLSRHSTSAQALTRVFCFGTPGLIICTWAVLVSLNGFMDTSSPVKHVAHVIDKHISRDSKYGDKYYLIVTPWEPGQPPYNFRVSKSNYDLIPLSTSCTIRTKKGFFGFEWIPHRMINFQRHRP